MSGKKLKIADRKKLFIAIGAIVAIILILILLISSIKSARARKKAEEEANKPREITVQVTVNGTGISNDEADALIKEYFTRYYTYLGKLDSANIDMSDLFDQNSDEGLYAEHLEKAAMDYIITYRSNYPELSLGFGSANITINYEKLTTNSDGTLELELNINEAIKYDHTSPDTSYWAKQKHAFVLISTSEGYRIVSHTADGPLDTLLSLMKASISSDSAYSLDALRDKVDENLNTWKESAKALTDKIYTDLANYNADSSKENRADSKRNVQNVMNPNRNFFSQKMNNKANRRPPNKKTQNRSAHKNNRLRKFKRFRDSKEKKSCHKSKKTRRI